MERWAEFPLGGEKEGKTTPPKKKKIVARFPRIYALVLLSMQTVARHLVVVKAAPKSFSFSLLLPVLSFGNPP